MSQAGSAPRERWWRTIGPALITACVVFGPGSLLISSNVGARYGFDLLWLLVITGVLMGTYMSMAARIGVMGGATPCQLVAKRAGRVFAAVIGINLCLICTAFQFSNNLAVAAAVDTLGIEKLFGDPEQLGERTMDFINSGVLLVFNGLIITLLFSLKQVYRILEKSMKFMVGIMLACFVLNLILVQPSLLGILGGLIPSWPQEATPVTPGHTRSDIATPLIVIASLLGTTFSVAGAFFQGNLVREKGWGEADYDRSIGDSLAGVTVLTCVSGIIMITCATVLLGQPANDIGVLATQLRPLLGPIAHGLFCVGLLAVAMNPFVINAMIGGAVLADGLGQPPKLSDLWPRRFTIGVLLVGMLVAMIVVHTPVKKVDAIIFGQALTVIGNPLMAGVLIWLANRSDIMGPRRNRLWINIIAVAGFCVVLAMAIRVLVLIVPKILGSQ
jgi:Mn2+/Fe2+ NRAMP family transporter